MVGRAMASGHNAGYTADESLVVCIAAFADNIRRLANPLRRSLRRVLGAALWLVKRSAGRRTDFHFSLNLH
jgi:hypothetical protein